MRIYDREELRHLNDSERYRDYEYLAEEFPGPNEQVFEPHLVPVDDSGERTAERESAPTKARPGRTGKTGKTGRRAAGGLLRGAVSWAVRALGGPLRRSVARRRRAS